MHVEVQVMPQHTFAEQLIERDYITCADEIWGRAVPIDLHGDPNRKCLTRSAEERGMRML